MNSTTTPVAFQFNSREVRTIVKDGEPWFVATDVCSTLGYRDASNGLRCLDEDEKGTHSVSTPGGTQKLTIINESGLYALVLRSKKPEARKFAKWVTREVLPAIRKTGRYEEAAGVAHITPEQLLADALSHGRWFMSFADGRITLRPVPDEAMVVSSADLATMVREPCSVSIRDLPAIINAASTRLNEWVVSQLPALRGAA